MCATPDKAALKERRSRKGTLRGWKLLERSGGELRSDIRNYRYVAGANYPYQKSLKSGQYVRARPCGLHVFRFKRKAWYVSADRGEVLVPVTYQPSDVIAADDPKGWHPQVVVRKLRFSQRAYDKAMEG